MKRLIVALALSVALPASALAQSAADFLLSYIAYQSFNGGYVGTALKFRNTCKRAVRAPEQKFYSFSLFAAADWEFGAPNPVNVLTQSRHVATGAQDTENPDFFEVSHFLRGKDKKRDRHIYRFTWTDEWELLFSHTHMTRRTDGRKCLVQYIGELF